jgi:CheY-like chemotaxis protein
MNDERVVILVLDDQPDVLGEIAGRLRSAHPEWLVRPHETARAAFADPLYQQGKVAVVVSDHLLERPEPAALQGLDVLIKMLRAQPRLSTILITQSRVLDLGAEALRWGVLDFIRKEDGWLEKLLRAVENGVEQWQSGGEAGPACFAVMPFGGWFNDLYRTVWKPAARTTGFSILRNDELPAGGRLLDEITAAIEAAAVVIVDLTQLRPNVLFEAGLAIGRGKRVIWVTSELDKIPSDLRTFHFIVYDRDSERWAERLEEELVRALGRAARPVPA